MQAVSIDCLQEMLIYKEIILIVHHSVIGDLISPLLIGPMKPVCGLH